MFWCLVFGRLLFDVCLTAWVVLNLLLIRFSCCLFGVVFGLFVLLVLLV